MSGTTNINHSFKKRAVSVEFAAVIAPVPEILFVSNENNHRT